MKVLIIGGTGNISRCITQQLLEGNHEVSLFNRGLRKNEFAGKLEIITGDKRATGVFDSLLEGKSFDCVIDMIPYDINDAKQTIGTLRDKTQHFIFCSTCAAYERPFKSLPIKEEKETLCLNPGFPYGYKKGLMENYLNEMMKELNITIIRPSLTFGEGCSNVGTLRHNYNIIDRINKGKPLIMFGEGTCPWTFTFSPDLAQGFVLSALNPAAYGKSYHVTSGELTYWDDLYLEFGRFLGKEPVIKHITAEMLMYADEAQFASLYYDKSSPGYFDMTKFKTDVPAFAPKYNLKKGIELIGNYFINHANKVDVEKDLLEDRLCKFYDEACEALKKAVKNQ